MTDGTFPQIHYWLDIATHYEIMKKKHEDAKGIEDEVGEYSVHDKMLMDISRLESLSMYWKDASSYFAERFCELTGKDLYQAWLEYEDYLLDKDNPL